MSDMTVNTAAGGTVQHPAPPERTRFTAFPRMDILDVSGIDMNRVCLSHQTGNIHLNNERTAAVQSYREETVIDFAHGTVSRNVGETVPFAPQNEGAFWRDDAMVRITFSASSYQSGQLEEVIREMAADHRERENALRAYFSGEELEQTLAELDELYCEGQDAAASSFANMVDCFWERRGQGGLEQREKVRGSVETLFAAFRDGGAQEQEGFLSLRELDFAAVSIAATLRSANLPSGRAQGVKRYRNAAAMQNAEISHLIGQG